MIEWRDTMEIGVSAIDAEHRHLIEFANLVARLPKGRSQRLATMNLLSDLRELFRQHFEQEEDLMFRVEYPKVDKHLLMHCTMMTQFDMCLQNSEHDSSVLDTLALVTDWIVNHIKTEDTSLASFIFQRRQAVALAKAKTKPKAAPKQVAGKR